MIEIKTLNGDIYSFDPNNKVFYKNGKLATFCEPVYSDSEDGTPIFTGIYLKDKNSVLTLSGTINPITDSNSII